jgi:K+-transporting ATPase A subunit
VSLPGILQVVVYVALLVAITRPMGSYLARILGPLERAIYRLTAVNPDADRAGSAIRSPC